MGPDFEKSKSRKKKGVDEEGGAMELGGDQSAVPIAAVSVPNVISPNKANAPATITIEIEEIPTFITGIVYCRDHKVLNKLEEATKNMSTPGFYNLRHLI
jgi:hypothetical protein